MEKQNDQEFYQFSGKEKDFSKSVHNWLAQYDEEDDFLRKNVPNFLQEFTAKE